VPFTPDTAVTSALLDEAVVGMAGNQTMLGDAIGLAVRLFRNSEAKSRVVILLTDGNDTGSLVPPVRAAAIAGREQIVLHVVGFGDPTSAGEQPLNEAVLTEMAKQTGGVYFHTADTARLDAVYAELDALEKAVFDSRTYTPKRQLFYLPLSAAVAFLLLFVLALAVRERRKGKEASLAV
jgi:Ca-activated chloride channel family protein